MSPLDRPVPPAGEELHLPGGSVQPVLLAVFLSVLLVGLTWFWPVSVAAAVGIVWVIVAWIRDTRREMGELPLHHDGH